MTEHEDLLRETFENHATSAPDPEAVYAKVRELSRTYLRRRRAVQATGTAVLGVGLIAGAVNLPSTLSGPSSRPGYSAGAAVVVPTPLVIPTYSESELEADWVAYFDAGYGYDDAVALAALWNTDQNIGLVKAEAGRRLLNGESLPVSPHPNQDASSSPDPDAAANEAAWQAYFAAGYDYDDAVQLAALWNLPDPESAKIAAGKKLEAGQTLPIAP